MIRIFEVGPRDGLQNEPTPVPTPDKVAFIEALVSAGLMDVEVGSFVRPDLVPQLADSEEIFRTIERKPGVRYWALVPNSKGLERAREVGVEHVAVFTAASDGFNRANINASVEESLTRLKPVIREAKDGGLTVRGYVSTVFGCPYDGAVEPSAGARVSRTLLDSGCDEISLGDTIGVAVPAGVDAVLAAHEAMGVPREVLALHLHDTRGTALANVCAGILGGITAFDSSAGGLGGCPFAPGATGNLATEDLLYLLQESGLDPGVSFEGVAGASGRISEILGRSPSSRARAAWASKRGKVKG